MELITIQRIDSILVATVSSFNVAVPDKFHVLIQQAYQQGVIRSISITEEGAESPFYSRSEYERIILIRLA
jgi:hypothetical protein